MNEPEGVGYALVQIRIEATTTDADYRHLIAQAAVRADQANGTYFVIVGPDGVVHREPLVPGPYDAEPAYQFLLPLVVP